MIYRTMGIVAKEVYREKETIREVVKVRCRHCGTLFEERLNSCPHCGAPG
jgi:rubrerythrin